MKVFRACVAILMCLLCLAGCQNEGLSAGEKISEDEASNKETASLSAIDWKTDGFAVTGELREEQSLWAAEYIKWEHKDNIEGGLMCGMPQVFKNRIYQLFMISNAENADSEYLLEIYDTSTMHSAVTEIDSDKLNMDGGFIADMRVLDQEKYAFLTMKYNREESGEAIHFQLSYADMVYTDLGDEIEKLDLMPAIQEMNQDDIHQQCFCDAFGNIYLRGISGGFPTRYLYILDQTGSLRIEQKLEENDEMASPFLMPDGELIYPINNYGNKTARLVWFDLDDGKMHILASLEKESILQVYGVQGTELYYESYDGIVKWDLVSGDRTLIFSFEENSVSRIYNTMLVFRDGQTPVFRMYAEVNGKTEDWLVVLSEQEPEQAEAMRVVSLNGDSANVKDCVALASRRNPNLAFSYETGRNGAMEDFRTRILAEMVAGNGPDILYVSLEDMIRLQDMGALADLDSFLTEETKDRILPGIIELGTVNGTFVGIAPNMDVDSLVTLKSIWEPDVWRLEDIIGLLDTGDFTGIFCQGPTSFAPQAQLKWLTMFGLQESILIDWETRESHFDSDLFLKILELARDYGNDDPIGADTWLGGGGCLGEIRRPGIESFKELYEQYGEEYHFVGMPTKENSGNYLYSQGVLVVNKNTANSEAVSAYLNSLLEDEIQYANRLLPNYSILKVSLEEIRTLELGDETRIFWKDNRLLIKEDGTTTLQDYKDFLESCIPRPEQYDDILNMVWEEAQSYMAGDKSAKEVARIVDSRIQLYLDEGNGR